MKHRKRAKNSVEAPRIVPPIGGHAAHQRHVLSREKRLHGRHCRGRSRVLGAIKTDSPQDNDGVASMVLVQRRVADVEVVHQVEPEAERSRWI